MLQSNSSRKCHQLHKLPLLLILCVASDACTQADSDSLMGFLSTIMASTPLNWNSTGPECCSWEGITCENGFVTRIWLPRRGLKGQISPSLGLLTHLSQLNLSRNLISGDLPAGFFARLDRLQVLDLSFNGISGKLSLTSNLDSLQAVDISSNFFSGEFAYLGSSPNLTVVNVSNNSFSGPIPSSICISSGLIWLLDLSVNKFGSPIANGFGRCSKLEIFRAGFNNLSGNLPDDLYNAIALREISLPLNKLSGILSTSILRLSNLTVLELFGNSLVGQLPQNIGQLANLEQLILYNNNFTGSLPLSLADCKKLKSLNLRNNFIDGEISIDFTRFYQLNTLDLGNNDFSGNLPTSLYSCKSLTAIRLARNNLQGQILSDVISLQSLSYISLSRNKLVNLKGALQALVGCKNLTALILSGNFYEEPIPDNIGGDGGSFQNLRVLSLGSCQLTGQIPNWIRDSGRLEALDLSLNQLTGSIPGWLGNQPNLFYIDLSGNHLSGTFPLEITDLPTLVSKERAAHVDQSYLELPVFVKPGNSSGLMYTQLSDLPPAIYLGNNSLEGEIPAEIGKLQVLHVLDLSHNNFSGEIPDQLSNLTNLEKLDLSGNHLSGTIPPLLKHLNFMSTFSVAYNDLQGPIPTGGQFDTFPRSSFLGNPGLCGWILLQPCNRAAVAPAATKRPKNLKTKVIIGAIIGICFGTAVLILVTLCVLSRRRIDPRGESEDTKVDFSDILSCNSNGMIPTDIIAISSLIVLFPTHHELKNLTISDIFKATDNFDQANIIGCGGFGLVYKATLANGTKLAVKRLSGDLDLMEREFKSEVEALSSAQHENLVSLRGYCAHGSFRLLLYSYMENGSLDYWLHERIDRGSKLDWPTRLKIAQGTSRGVAYLHQICEPHIIHRDIKSSNILLDEDFEAHVADFGLSRLILPYNTHVTTELVGTLGYIPPEYGQAWKATLRGDVYSFGVVMLELLTGKRPVEVFKPKGSASRELVVWVQQMRLQGKQDDVFDPLLVREKGEFEEEMLQVLDVGCMCVNQNPFKRPTIQEVVDWLHNVGSSKTSDTPTTPKT